ncbi:DNA-binding protein [Sulfurisphaera javensis]|uniref:DNA/RNA-binding protein Alba n=1 Tax=Sulfurisphaera javensis TaxID=2049879 RepID=A0AAT9GU68_9CREN
MTTKKPNEILISRAKRTEDYVLDVIVMFNQGYDEVELKGVGNSIYKAVEVYNLLKDRLGDGIKLEKTDIGSEVKDRRRISYISIRLKRVY